MSVIDRFEDSRCLRLDLERLLSRMPRRSREVAFHLMEDCTEREIARRMGISRGAVIRAKVHLQRLALQEGVA